jgi:hypothetical protein
MKWLEVVKPAPVLNCPDFTSIFGGKSGVEIPRNQDGHPESYEFVALPGMYFLVISQIDLYIFQIEALEYTFDPLYIDIRFCQMQEWIEKKQPPRFTASYLLQQMEKRIGTPYLWGGNWADGIPEMLEYYRPSGKLDLRTEALWTFRGLDCSGLLFEASLGSTPRNSSALVLYGHSIEMQRLRAMDMIVYPGHVLFVLDEKTIIESKSPFGVRIQPLQKRLDEILLERKFVQHWEKGQLDPAHSFTIRRFCEE